ncbi:hypothetical protein [Nocardiopsis synnemataformans]|uniref:hypothetical protein n=1 Tax=Nocardiopsis synnemataformans TaxID=61305 RepID=UPI003EBD3B6A
MADVVALRAFEGRVHLGRRQQFDVGRERLFDAVFFASPERITNVAPIDAEDLADWAVRLYDEYLARPAPGATTPGVPRGHGRRGRRPGRPRPPRRR